VGMGAILLTGASASVKGSPQSAIFAMGEFAPRGLAQSTVRELGAQGHSCSAFVIDGGGAQHALARSTGPPGQCD